MSNYDLHITVSTQYIATESKAEESRYVFAYTLIIKNTGTVGAKLLSRHWIITDANNHVQEVEGKGVIGEQPYLKPEGSFKYTSGTMIETPVGSMQGTYQMVADDGFHFEATIAPFSLAVPGIVN